MRIGLVGTGRIGASHVEVVAAHPEVAEVVVADVDAARARTVAQRCGVRAAESVVEVLRPGAVDGLVIAAATAAHAELITAGVRAGIPVFCEKPVAASVPATVAVLREVERAGAAVHIGFQRRFDTGYLRARQAVRDGEIGELHRVHAITGDPEPPHPDYIPASGGIFRDCHVHDFDILHWVTGREVIEVHAMGANRGADFFAAAGDVDNAVALLRLDDGTLVTLQGTRYNGAGYDVRMELAGTRGTVAVGLEERVPLTSAEPGVTFPGGTAWPNFWERFAPAYRAEINAFVDVVSGAGEVPCTVAEALEAVLVAEAADRSLRGGVPVRLADVRAAFG